MTQKTTHLDRSHVAKILATLKPKILVEWESLARLQVPGSKHKSHYALLNSLPQLIDQLVEKLASLNPSLSNSETTEIIHTHAETRASLTDYNLDQVIAEYRLFRLAIMNNLESQVDFNLDSAILKIIHEFIDSAIQKAAVWYTELDSVRQAKNKEIENAKNEAERANEEKSAFLANMSHEIRTPLGSIMGFIDLLQEPDISAAESKNYLSIIKRNSRHLLRIIDDILDLSKVESGKMSIENVEFSLMELLADFSSLAGLRAREKGIEFEFKAESLLPEFVISDPTRIRQILTNVVGNALKFTSEGKVQLRVSFKEHRLIFRVIDTGRGISAHQRPKLFQAFSQGDSATSRKFGGTGLGLVLTKKMCQALGGDFLLIESKLGKGSTFESQIVIDVPEKVKIIQVTQLQSPTINTPDMQSSQKILDGMRVLVVDDSPDNQMLIQMILNKSGANVSVANDGLEGINKAISQDFDIVLMDIQMPNIDGYEAVRILREKNYRVPIVALTAHAMKEERSRAIKAGFSHFLTKPIERTSLIELLIEVHSSRGENISTAGADELSVER